MTYYEDLSQTTMVAAGPHVRAVGWLDNKHDFPTGTVPAEFIRTLRRITDYAYGAVFFGYHTCDICRNFNAGRNIFVPARGKLYVAPEMVLHYITAHRYLPPRQFIDAVMDAPIPGTRAYRYRVAWLRFWG